METPEERKKRKQREATARYRAKHPERARELGRQADRRRTAKKVAYNKEHRRLNPELHAEYDKRKKAKRTKEQKRDQLLRWKYGISLEDYHRMWDEQDGFCPICEQSPEELVVDHCHETGEVRGLLCRKCNAAIGQMHDDPEIVRNAVKYLENQWSKSKPESH